MEPAGGGQPGQAGQDVVGFVARRLIKGDPKRGDDFFKDRELDDEFFGHGLALGLVLLEGFMPDRRALGVENHSQVIRAFGFDELPQRADKTVDGVGREAPGVRKPLDGVKSPVEERIAVDEEESFAGPLRRGHRGPSPSFKNRSNFPSAISWRIVLCWSSTIRWISLLRFGLLRKEV